MELGRLHPQRFISHEQGTTAPANASITPNICCTSKLSSGTLTREWAYGCCLQNSDQRTTYLPYYLHDYNWHRPHTSLNRLPPTSRLPFPADNLLSLHS